jgi:hypothetical protein
LNCFVFRQRNKRKLLDDRTNNSPSASTTTKKPRRTSFDSDCSENDDISVHITNIGKENVEVISSPQNVDFSTQIVTQQDWPSTVSQIERTPSFVSDVRRTSGPLKVRFNVSILDRNFLVPMRSDDKVQIIF